MNKICVKLITVGSVLIMAGGCANISSLQTAQTLKPNTGELVVGGGYFTMPDVNEALSDDTGESVHLSLPYAELMYRRGFFENFDAGLKLTIVGTVAVDGKYRLMNTEGFALATGLGLGYVKLTSESDSGGEKTKNESTIVDVTVPLHMSYDVSDMFAVYLSPKYNLRSVDSDIAHLGGATMGMRVGEGFGVYLEASYLLDLADADGGHILQYNAALYF